MRAVVTLFLIVLAWPLLSSTLAIAAEGSPSFECRRASTLDERTVCGSLELSNLDRIVSDTFGEFEPEFSKKKDIARGVLRDRKTCGSDTACIAAVYADALSTYGGLRAPIWPSRYAQALMLRKAEAMATGGPGGENMPNQIGECSRTTISALVDRFGRRLDQADETTGSSVEFTNGGRQVSYAREVELALSEVGDDVVVCLIEVPRDCPEGDDRGHTFLSLNEDKGFVWVLGDTQHVCGGA